MNRLIEQTLTAKKIAPDPLCGFARARHRAAKEGARSRHRVRDSDAGYPPPVPRIRRTTRRQVMIERVALPELQRLLAGQPQLVEVLAADIPLKQLDGDSAATLDRRRPVVACCYD
jgi:hypothetical protein